MPLPWEPSVISSNAVNGARHIPSHPASEGGHSCRVSPGASTHHCHSSSCGRRFPCVPCHSTAFVPPLVQGQALLPCSFQCGTYFSIWFGCVPLCHPTCLSDCESPLVLPSSPAPSAFWNLSLNLTTWANFCYFSPLS